MTPLATPAAPAETTPPPALTQPGALARPIPAPAPAMKTGHRRALAFLVLLWLILFAASLFAPPVLDDADGTHANAARQMALSGDWVTLRVNNVRYLEKAPLPYWIVAISFRLFGIDTFATHLPQALAVLLLTLLGFRWAREAFGDRAALYTGLALLTSAGVFLFTRVFIPDILLSLLLATALYCFLHSLTDAQAASTPHFSPDRNTVILSVVRHRRTESKDPDEAHTLTAAKPFLAALYPYLFWIALALAVLTKGLVALVFLAGTAALYLALTGEYRQWRRLRPVTGTLLMLAIAAPWHILAGLRNTGGMNGHGFFWFYFINEHVLRFLGQRIPRDYNKLPGYLYWSLHLVWLFPWALFLPVLIAQWDRRWRLFLRRHSPRPPSSWVLDYLPAIVSGFIADLIGLSASIAAILFVGVLGIFREYNCRRVAFGETTLSQTSLTTSQRTTLLLGLFSTLVLLFFSISTNQEYYTFPTYLPLLMLIAAALARAEDPSNPASRTSYLTAAHAALTVIGLAASCALAYGLWTSRHLAFVPDIGNLLAHRGVGDYTLSMSALFDLTGPSFAALRLPTALALAAFAVGPATAWVLRHKRHHLAATTTIALTSALFLIAAHIALVRFAPMLSSQDFAERIQDLEATHAIAPASTLLLYGDQAYGSSIPFYLNRPLSQPALLVDGRSSSMLFGSTFPDAAGLFLSPAELLARWGAGPRKLLFVPLERRDEVDRLLGPRQIVLEETSGKALITDRPLDH
jgi:4-amino-4-deoxy-L-arabinose transferase-like glycosyltransferase